MRNGTKTGHGRRSRAVPGASAGTRLALALACASMLLSSCVAEPKIVSEGGLSLESFFDGHSVSRGTIDTLYFWKEPFTADFQGKRTQAGLDLQETFHFADGDRLQSWNLSNRPGGRYSGTVRTALETGRMSPKSDVSGYRTEKGAVLAYEGYAPGGGNTRLDFRHVMQKQDDGTVLNTVTVSKFGLRLAKAKVVFSKHLPAGDD